MQSDETINYNYFANYAKYSKNAYTNTNNLTDADDLPKIGINRTFNKKLKVNSFAQVDEEANNSTQNQNVEPDGNATEAFLLSNSANHHKYKTEGCVIVFDELLNKQTNNKIGFTELLNILALDETSVDNFIDKEKGTWVDKFEDSDEPSELEFESRFESGNLRMAIKVSDNEYDLILKNDINSGKSYYWFNFQIKMFLDKLNKSIDKIEKVEISDTNNINIERMIKFNIINCQKNDMLFSKGLRVLKFNDDEQKWSRDTKNIFYYLNGLCIDDKKFYTLTFSIVIPSNTGSAVLPNLSKNNKNYSTIYFSYCYPYTFSDLQNYLSYISSPREDLIIKYNIEDILRMECIGTTLSGNKIQMLLITDFMSSFEEIAQRKAVILTSRVHPGETNASFVIQGVIDFLIDPVNLIACKLRSKFIFKIIPMLNPDGVINGNFRTSLIGKDLNRMWGDPRDNLCPSIYYTKEMIRRTLQSREVFLFCDFHGHSNKNNFFLYGCTTSTTIKKNKSSTIKTKNVPNTNYTEIVLSRIFQTKNSYFDLNSCTYKIAQSKLKTARAILKNEFNIDFSYCLESSIGTITLGEYKNSFFTPKLYHKIGVDFILSLNDLCDKQIYYDTLTKLQIEEALKLVELSSNIGKIIPEGEPKNNLNGKNTKKKKETIGSTINILKVKKKVKTLKMNLSQQDLIKIDSNVNINVNLNVANVVNAKVKSNTSTNTKADNLIISSISKRSKTNPKK